jgi:branched-chain amino acid transport system substrate-binding protein
MLKEGFMKAKGLIFFMSLFLIGFLFPFAPLLPAADPIVIGVPTFLTHVDGKESLNTLMLAVDEINAKGGVKVGAEKKLFKVEALDIRDGAPGVPVPEALLGIEKVILEKKPAALLVGPFRSEALMAAMDLIAKYKVPMIGTIAMIPASEDKIRQDPAKYKYIFRTCLNAKYLVSNLIGMMTSINKDFGFTKVFVMHQDVAWARATATGVVKNYLEKAGWTVLGQEAYPTGASDFSSALMKAQSGGAQVILPVFDMASSAVLVKQWNSMKVPALMAGFISPLGGASAWKTFDQKIGGAINVNFELGSAIASKKWPKSDAFEQAFEKKYGRPLDGGHGEAPSYDAVYILKEAIERAGSLNPDAVVAALEKTDYSGVTGRTRFDNGHQAIFGMDPKEANVAAAFQWTDKGGRTVVFPESIAEGKIQLPAGLKPAK